MSSSLALAFNRFSARSDETIKVWVEPPSLEIINDFKQHVREYGTPDLWAWHSHTKPQRNSDYRIVCSDVTIPDKLRPDVGMAPCPNCSIAAPKYYTCRLLWFPADKALRAVGHECAKDISGEHYLRKEEARYEKEQAAKRALDFIISNADKVPYLLTVIEDLLPRIRKADEYADLLRKALSEKTRKNLVRLADNVALPLYETQKVPALDRHGFPILDKDDNAILRTQQFIAQTINVSGLLLFKNVKKFEGQLASANGLIFELVNECKNDDAIIALCELLDKDGLLLVEKSIRTAWQIAKEAIDRLALAQSFFELDNIKRLGEWARDSRAELQFKVIVKSGGTFYIGDQSFKNHSAFYPCQEIYDPLPILAPLT